MDMTTMILIGIIPTTLITLGGLLVMKTGKKETAERRFLLYLVSVSIVMLLIVVVADLFSTDMNQMPGMTASSIISTAILGVLALIFAPLAGTERAAAPPMAALPCFDCATDRSFDDLRPKYLWYGLLRFACRVGAGTDMGHCQPLARTGNHSSGLLPVLFCAEQ